MRAVIESKIFAPSIATGFEAAVDLLSRPQGLRLENGVRRDFLESRTGMFGNIIFSVANGSRDMG